MHPTQTIPRVLLPRALTTVEINGIATPFNRALDSLQRFCRPLLFHRENSPFDLAYSGSSFLFRHRTRNFLICCKHQLASGNISFTPNSICLIVKDDGRWKALTPDSSTIIKVDSYHDRTAEDILLIEYEPERSGLGLSRYFVSLNLDTIHNLASVTRHQILLIFAIGYPTRFSDYDVNFDETESPVSIDIVSRWAKLYLQVRERSEWDLESRIPLKLDDRWHADIGDPDGFSGSPVFFIWQDTTRQTHLGFAGIITHGSSSGSFQVYPTETIREIVNRMIDHPETET